MLVERFSIDCRETPIKVIVLSKPATNVNSPRNQSGPEVNACHRRGKRQAFSAKRGKTPARKSRLVLFLIG